MRPLDRFAPPRSLYLFALAGFVGVGGLATPAPKPEPRRQRRPSKKSRLASRR